MFRLSNLTSRGVMIAAVAVLLGACTTAPTSPPASTPVALVPPSAAASSEPSTAPATAAVPGSIVVLACGTAPAAGSVCLGDASGTIQVRAAKGSNLNLSLVVNNPGGTASTPVSVLLYQLDAGTLPLGQPICTTCNSTSGKSVIGLEWLGLAPGETRTVTVDIPVTGAAGNTMFIVDLYAQALADVMAAEIANGIQPGQQTWKVAVAIAAP
jgi:hypothetical protein